VSSPPDLPKLEETLGYKFAQPELLVTALTHRSWANENPQSGRVDNEKLEFLGDAVLDLVVGHLLMESYPDLREGQLSVTRAQVVSEAGLAEVARMFDLGTWLFLGKGEDKSGGREKPSLLSDALEALVAAVYLDGGFDASWQLVVRLFGDRVDTVEMTGFYDFKTRLQELSQRLLKATPVYEVVPIGGPDHAKVFEARVLIEGVQYGVAEGRSKKAAEREAAAAASFRLSTLDPGTGD